MNPLLARQFFCPYCGADNILWVDVSEGLDYDVDTDCDICCRPLALGVRIREEQVEIVARPGSL